MTDLCEIGKEFGTDKVEAGYTSFYHTLFADYVNGDNKILEIGIGTVGTMKHVPGYKPGASLFMWEAYFPNGQVFGLDIDASVLISRDRIKSRQCNQLHIPSLEQAAEWAGDNFFLIIDDGLHTPEANLTAFSVLFPLLAPEGFYIIEDADRYEDICERLKRLGHEYAFVHLSQGGKLILIRKGATPCS